MQNLKRSHLTIEKVSNQLRESHVTSNSNEEKLNPFQNMYTNIRCSNRNLIKDQLKESTDTTSRHENQKRNLWKTPFSDGTENRPKTFSRNKQTETPMPDMEDFESEQDFAEMFRKDPIFKLRVQRLMKDLQKRAKKSPSLKKLLKSKTKENDRLGNQLEQNDLRMTFKSEKERSDLLLKKYVDFYSGLLSKQINQALYTADKKG